MRIEHDAANFRFNMYTDDNKHIGEIEYRPSGTGEWYATHTEVFPGNEGKGYAGQLLDALAKEAEAQGAKIVPLCPYVVAAFKKYPEKYAAVIK